jgi:hypothetical protein
MRAPVVWLLVAPLSAQAPSSMDALSWITGTWRGTLGSAVIEEHWRAPQGGRMLGLSSTVSGDRMVAFEFLRIEQRPEGLFYVAQPNGWPPTDFKLTRLAGQEAVFENPQHDHPKVITYRRDGDSLTARIEGDQRGQHAVQEFRFRRVP